MSDDDGDLLRLVGLDDIREGARVTVLGNLIHAVELVMTVCGQERKVAACTLGRVLNEFSLVSELLTRTIPGKGNANVKFLTLKGAIQLINVLPGSFAKQFRIKCAETVVRVLGGDMSLVDEIKANAASNAPLNVMARECMAADGGVVGDPAIAKKRNLLELEMLEALIQEKRAQTCKFLLESTKEVSEDGVLDSRDRLFFKDMFHNLAAGDQLAITNGDSPISVSSVGMELGYKLTKNESSKIGKIVARMYREKYGEEPDKHEQFVDGRVCKVNSYTKKDQKMVEEGIRNYMQGME